MVKIGFIFGLLGLLLLANTCSAAAGLTMEVSAPDGMSVTPGESISYIITVYDDEIGNPDDPEFDPGLAEWVNLSINRTEKGEWTNPEWFYAFDPSQVRLESSADSNSSTLTFQVPIDAKPGIYSHNVEAAARNEYDTLFNLDGRVIVNVINTDVNAIPEFPTIALPVAAVLGLVFVFGRRKE